METLLHDNRLLGLDETKPGLPDILMVEPEEQKGREAGGGNKGKQLT